MDKNERRKMFKKMMKVIGLCGVAFFAGWARGDAITAITGVSANGLSPTRAVLRAEVVGEGDVFAEFAHRRGDGVRDLRHRYVNDGLIALWDGEDNQGTGVHAPGATDWVDITGRHAPLQFEALPTVNANNYDLSAGGGWIENSADIATAVLEGNATIEIVCEVSELVHDGAIFALVDGNGSRIAWARTGSGDSGCLGVVGSVDYCSSTAYDPWPNIDTSLNARATYSFDFAAEVCSIHKNGAENPAASVVNKKVSGDASSAYFSLGRRISAQGKSPAVSKIKIYSVRVYNRRLSAAERAANHAVDEARFTTGRTAIDLDHPGRAIVETVRVGRVGTFADCREAYAAPDDLLAMWDGEDNQGTGTHDANATTWVDATGRHDPMSFEANPTVNARNYDLSAGGGYITDCADVAQAILNANATIEITCEVSELVNDGTLFSLVDGNNVRIAWARTGNGSTVDCLGIVGSVDYRSSMAYAPWPNIDTGLNVIATYSFDFADDLCSIHKDGAASPAASVVNKKVSGDASTAYFSLGRRTSMGGKSAAISKIKIYSVRIYNRRLTAKERAVNHAVDLARFTSATPISLGDRVAFGESALAMIDGAYAFTLDGLRADQTTYTARLFATNGPGVKSAPVVFDTVPESLAFPWYEWIDSRNGGIVADVGFNCSGRTPVVQTKFQLLGGENTWLCANVSGMTDNCFLLGWPLGENVLRYRIDQTRGGVADMALNAVHEVSVNGPDGLVIDGRVVDASFSGIPCNSTMPWYLFGRYVTDSDPTIGAYIHDCHARVWSFKLWADGEPVCDLVGARIPDGRIDMFNRVTRKNTGLYGRGAFCAGPLKDTMPFVKEARLMGRMFTARLTRTAGAASDVYLACGATYAGVSASSWNRFEKLETGFAAEGDALDVILPSLAKDVRYIRFLSLEDGWSDTVFVGDLPAQTGTLMLFR